MTHLPAGAIGAVAIHDGRTVATLVGPDEWSVTSEGRKQPHLAAALAELYRDRFRGPAWGYYGQALLQQVAADLGGTVTIREFPPPEPGAVY